MDQGRGGTNYGVKTIIIIKKNEFLSDLFFGESIIKGCVNWTYDVALYMELCKGNFVRKTQKAKKHDV